MYLLMGIFFWYASKKQRRNMRKIIEMSKNNDYGTGNLLDNEYFSNHLNIKQLL